MVKVVTSSGGVMELYSPITAECITNEFPGHGVFRSPHHVSPPLFHNEQLRGGRCYYLLPLHGDAISARGAAAVSFKAPYRMSVDDVGVVKRKSSEAEVFSRFKSGGVWKVRLVISTEQLSEILSQEARTEELIEDVRTAVKCATGSSSSAANSDQWSLSGSW
ncbi:hypothetical protein F511_12252 [Dorcoceras hygrometricum]|uniref:Uncharacterized protein n=1 Tax=Dorcoceras hygrometricum TaxID=472368 RepID=A0A2Z7ABR7_9LAMI|nr:hypothetical protein F511_12252 [Dorcoceras hygrometricum]